MPLGPGLVAVPALELVHAAFAASLAQLSMRLPAGSRVIFDTWGGPLDAKRNRMVRDWLLTDPALHWVLFVDSDQCVPIDALERLAAHRVPIVGALIMRRSGDCAAVRPRPELVGNHESHIDALTHGTFNANGFGSQTGRLRLGGLQRVEAVGAGCLFVRREVFASLPEPWFASDLSGLHAGTNEDLNFCHTACVAGFPICCDTDLVVGHLVTLSMTPAVANALRGVPAAHTRVDGTSRG